MGDIQDLNRFATRGFMNQWSATRPARLSGLSGPGKKWMKEQVARQLVQPRSPGDIAPEVNQAMARDIKELARAQDMKPDEVSRALVLKIMVDTRTALALAAWRAHRVNEKGQPSWAERMARADADTREAMKMQSDASLTLAMD